MTKAFRASETLAGLKDFQQRTVEYTFRRLFLEGQKTSRFLVADEVGLGKTLIARGLVAKVIEHLQNIESRIDVIYVCSNADIARQNIARLGVPGMRPFVMATRLTLLPLHIHNMRNNKINLISFTPKTTFDHGQRIGRKEERRLIYQMLRDLPGISRRALKKALQGFAGDAWSDYADESIKYDDEIALAFKNHVRDSSTLRAELDWLSNRYHDGRTLRTVSQEDVRRCMSLIGELRQSLSKECLKALEPDLVILDEFQRFRDLLRDPEENPGAELAHALFNHEKVRILLLSATPYKMYAADSDDEEHYADFLKTSEFLFQDRTSVATLEARLKDFRALLLRHADLPERMSSIHGVRVEIEALLRSVMCRTERVGQTAGRDGMVKECQIRPQLEASDFKAVRFVDRVGSLTGQGQDVIEYWKSGAYLLNFMKGYQIKERLREKANRRDKELADVMRNNTELMLRHSSFEKYEGIDAGNPRMRAIITELEQSGLWRLLWMPASMPYWKPEGPYSNVRISSKQLIFSAWNVVPDTIAALSSYCAERLVIKEAGYKGSYSSMPARFTRRLVFPVAADGRPSGMSTLALLFPSPTLAREIDPISIASTLGPSPSLAEVRGIAITRVRELLAAVLPEPISGSLPDRRWYWMALILLERERNPSMFKWCKENWATSWRSNRNEILEEDGGDKAFLAHTAYWCDCWQGLLPELGRMPDDLAEIVADLALAGYATCALRSLYRVMPGMKMLDDALLGSATRVAEGMRSQFNNPLAVALLKSNDDDAFWLRTLRYGLDGNLASVLDEYAHVLSECVSRDGCSASIVLRIADVMVEAMTLRSTQLRPDEVQVDGDHVKFESFPVRCHFAQRLGDLSDDAGAVTHKEWVRVAFNSPFRPFVLASTSVGQEGLDFHTWCHAIIHWNLPSNPVDMEQREGRVHRYKGYAVRKNVARRYRQRLGDLGVLNDPWCHVFDLAKQDRPEGASDLIPYWIFDVPGGDKIERRVFDMPYSRDTGRYHALKKGLSLYRLVFAQPRQEDLLAYLGQTVSEDELDEVNNNCLIRLEPT